MTPSARRAGWNLVDQVVSSLSNALVAIVVARAASAYDFGVFAIALTIALLVLSMARQVVDQPFLLVAAALEGEAFKAQARAVTGAALAFGAASGGIVAAAAVVVGGDVGRALLVAGAVLPALLVQDAVRFIAQARGRPQDAALTDTVWLVALVAGLTVLVRADVSEAWPYVAAWGLTALLAWAVAQVRLAWLPRLRRAWRWTWEQRGTSTWLFLEVMAAGGSVQVVLLVVSAVAGADDGGAWRGTQTLLGPVNVLGMAGLSFLVPELVRRPQMSARGRVKAAAALSGLLATANVLWAGSLLLLPASAGEQVLGDTWAGARDYLPPIAVWSAAVALSFGPIAVLQAIGQVRRAAWNSLALCPVLLLCAGVGLLLSGGIAAAYGVALAQVLVVPLWWRTVRRAVQEVPRPAGPELAVGPV